ESATGGAIALRVDRPAVGAKLGALDVEPAVARERGAVAAHACRGHAVEEIDAARYAFDEILREADAHQVAWPLARQLAVQELEDAIHVRLRLAHRQTANPEARPRRHVANRPRRADTK